MRDGDELTIGIGLRQWHYVAFRGGVAVDPILGSRSTDTLGRIGPPPIVANDRLALGPEPTAPVSGDVAPIAEPKVHPRVSAGPRVDWFVDGSFERFTTEEWTVAAASRVGVRLAGPALERSRFDELPSEGLVRGAIQVPPDGQPVMMLADHPTTGGYPVIAVVDPDDVAVVAQVLAGGSVRFRR